MKTHRRSCKPILIAACALALPVFFYVTAPRASAALSELAVRHLFQFEEEPLTTSRVWEIDPAAVNPHRKRWALRRDVELKGLQAVQKAPDHFGVRAEGVESWTRAYLRKPGPWYRPIAEFPCSAPETGPAVGAREEAFSTQEGARVGAQAGAKEWEKAVEGGKLKLSALLSRVDAPNAELAVLKARLLFFAWLDEMKNSWRERGLPRARAEEWSFYRKQAKESAVCGKSGKAKKSALALPDWKELMEPGTEPAPKKLLARAPSRLWNGLFTIRTTVTVGGHQLVGIFLVDSAAPASVISPGFLESQGIDPSWVLVTGSSPKRVKWSLPPSGEGSLGRKISVEKVEVSGAELPIRQFLLHETEFFAPPAFPSVCCDGVLGNDLLRMVSVEFDPRTPREVRFWKPEGFFLEPDKRGAAGAATGWEPWVEVALNAADVPFSSGQVLREGARKGHLIGPGLGWYTGSALAIGIHVPWRSHAVGAERPEWKAVSDGLDLLENAELSLPRPAGQNAAIWNERTPAAAIGARALDRGRFALDLPHGRFWISHEALARPVATNDSGLEVEYVFRKSDRALKVKAIRTDSPAGSLKKAGLTVGGWITQIDGVAVEDTDLWEIEQHLAGVYGDTVTVQWLAGTARQKGKKPENILKMAPLKLR